MKLLLEGFDFQDERNKSYSEINENLKKNRELIECNNKNDILCAEIHEKLKEKTQVLYDSKIIRNQKQNSFNECELKHSSCDYIYNEIQQKIQEFKQVYKEINNIEQHIQNCNSTEKNCNQIENLLKNVQKKHKNLEKKLHNSRKIDPITREKFVLLIEKNKLQIFKLKNDKKQCFRELKQKCSQKKDDLLINKKLLQTNIYQNIDNLNNAYSVDACEQQPTCYDLLAESNIAASDFQLHEEEHKIIQNDFDTCKDPYKNQCKDIFIDLEKYTGKINNDIMYMKHKLENMANLEENIEENKKISSIQDNNDNTKKNFKLHENPNLDNCISYESEVCKNIVLTTIASVLLYYFFFEI